MTVEEWREVPGWEGYYAVSDQGRVKSLARVIGRLGGPPNRVLPERVLQPARNATQGHLRLSLYRDGTRWSVAVHRLVLLAFVGPPAEGLEGCHNDGNPDNNCLSNLRWDTHSANVLDTIRHGTHYLAARDRCKNGHLLSGENLYVDYVKARRCRACKRASAARCAA